MGNDGLYSLAGFVLTAISAVLLYLGSEHQRLLQTAPPAPILHLTGAFFVILGVVAWVASWGGLVGGLLAVVTWMLVSVALPYICARRTP